MILGIAASATLAAGTMTFSRIDTAAAFRAAGFAFRRGAWRSDCLDAGNPSYAAGEVSRIADLNGDGRPEAIVTEGSTVCFGLVGSRFTLVSKQADGRWKRIIRQSGQPRFLPTTGSAGWPDIELALPGPCTPAYRWTGREYQLHRFGRTGGSHCKLRP
jgi:hypothetical protein